MKKKNRVFFLGIIMAWSLVLGSCGKEDKEPVSLTPGKVIVIPAEVKHWHGAKKDSWFSHIATEMPGEECSNEWCEPVTDEEYNKLG